MHQIIHLLQLTHPDRLERRLDQAPPEEIQGLPGILAIPHITALDRLHANHGLKDGRLEERTGGQTDRDDRAAGADILRRLLKRLLVDGDEQDGMGAHAILGRGLHIRDDVLAGREIDKRLRAQLARHHPGLLLARVDPDDLQTHRFRVLAGQAAQPAARAHDRDRLARHGAGFLEALVDRDAGAEDGGDGVEGDVLGDAGHVRGFADGVLLEGAVDGVAGQEGFAAEGLVRGLAEGAGEAGAVEPLVILGSFSGCVFMEVWGLFIWGV